MSAYLLEVKQQLLVELDTLPEHRLPELLTFVKFLQHQETKIVPQTEDDPLSLFIGGVEHGALAQQIDEDLYS